MDSYHTFKKEERISSKKEIELLFNQGSSYMSYPLRIVYVENKPLLDVPVSILISIPKKRLKHAVKRNRLKRLVREAYRLNKSPLHSFLKQKNKGLLIAFLFVGNDLSSFVNIERAIKKILNILQDRLS